MHLLGLRKLENEKLSSIIDAQTKHLCPEIMILSNELNQGNAKKTNMSITSMLNVKEFIF